MDFKLEKGRKRQIYFVCSAIHNSELITEMIAASESNEAANLFENKFQTKPQNILGPFLKKKVPLVEDKKTIQFNGPPKKAIYDGWLVSAFPLKEPQNMFLLIFIKRVDGEHRNVPKGTVLSQINDLRFI